MHKPQMEKTECLVAPRCRKQLDQCPTVDRQRPRHLPKTSDPRSMRVYSVVDNPSGGHIFFPYRRRRWRSFCDGGSPVYRWTSMPTATYPNRRRTRRQKGSHGPTGCFPSLWASTLLMQDIFLSLSGRV